MPFSDHAPPQDEGEGSRLAEAATRALQSARPWGATKQIDVPGWLVDAFVAECGAATARIPPERAQLTDEFLQGVHDAAVQFADVHGYGALALLVARCQGRLADLKSEYERTVQRAVLPFIARIADDDGGEVVVLYDKVADNPLALPLWVLQRFEFDEERPDETLPVHGLVVAARTPESADWEGDHPGDPSRGPVPVSYWVRGRVSSDPAFDPDDWADDDLAGSLDRFVGRAEEHRHRISKELDAVEVEAAVAADVLDDLLAFAPPSGAPRLTAVEVDTLRIRHRRALLIASRPFFLAAVAELRRSGRSTSIKKAFELLQGECADGSAESVCVAYASARTAEQALASLGANSAALKERGHEAFFGKLPVDERGLIEANLDLLGLLRVAG